MLTIRFIHTADLHLDRPFKGVAHLPEAIRERVRESTFVALDHLVRKAIIEAVDFIVISGDIFDQSHRSLRAQRRFAQAMNQLKDHSIEVFLSHGNHDPLDHQWSQLELGDNVHVFGPKVELLTFNKIDRPLVHLYGFSYPSRHVLEDQTPFYQKIDGADVHIGLLHGSISGNEEHDHYAPFALQSLINKGFDYWALGHIHKRQQLSADPAIWYPGNIQGLSIKETGEKGALLVELNEAGSQVTFFPISDIVWRDIVLEISEYSTVDDLLRCFDEQKEVIRHEEMGTLLRITLTGTGSLHSHLQDESLIEELLDAWRDGEDDQRSFIWPLAIKNDTSPNWDRNELMTSPTFIGDLLRLSDSEKEKGLKEPLSSVYDHRKAKRYIESLGPKDESDIFAEAETLLIDALYETKKDG